MPARSERSIWKARWKSLPMITARTTGRRTFGSWLGPPRLARPGARPSAARRKPFWVFKGICGRLLGVPRFARNEIECELRDRRLSSLGFLLAPLRVDHATVLATVKDEPAVALKSAILERRCARWPRARRSGRKDDLGRTDGWDIRVAPLRPLSPLALGGL